MNEKNYAALAHKTIFFGGIAVAGFLFWKYIGALLLPFALSAIFSFPIKKLAHKIAEGTKISKKFLSVFFLFLSFCLIIFLLKIGLEALFSEIYNLADRLNRDPEMFTKVFENVNQRLSSFGEKFAMLRLVSQSEALAQFTAKLESAFSDTLTAIMEKFSEKISDFAMSLTSKIPQFLLFVATFLLSCFYFCADDGKIGKALISLLPESLAKKLPQAKERLKTLLLGYLRSYLALSGIAFAICLLGLTILKNRYAILLSLIIAVVDILPVLGAGTVLIPWSAVCFLTGDSRMGVGLLIIYAVCLIVRQIAEPKIVGKSIGLHPLAALVGVYVGIGLFGFMGIFIGPLVMTLLKSLVCEKTKDAQMSSFHIDNKNKL